MSVLLEGIAAGQAARKKKQKAATRNKNQIKESDVRKIVTAGPFTAYHLRAGSELNVVSQDLWEMADKDLIDGVDKKALRMYKNSWDKGTTYSWYQIIETRLEEFIEALLTVDAVRRLEDI